MKKIILTTIPLIVLLFLFFNQPSIIGNAIFETKDFEGQREEVLTKLNLAIKQATEEGKYKCCIEPACTMCYLGNWIWDDGTCDCDGMIAKGENDKVCPQCIKGLEKGLCKYSQEDKCSL